MKRTSKIIVLAVSLLFLYGGELALIGVGAGGGIAGYKFYEGSSSKEFPLGYSKAWDSTTTATASSATLAFASIPRRGSQPCCGSSPPG